MSNEKKGLDEERQPFQDQELAQYGDPGQDVMRQIYQGVWAPGSGNVYAVMGEGYPFFDRATLANKHQLPLRYYRDEAGVDHPIDTPVTGLIVRTDTGSQAFLPVAPSRIATVSR